MPRNRGAANERSEARRYRGEHDNQTSRAPAAARAGGARASTPSAEATTDSLQLFFNQAMQYPLLTGPEEIELAQAIERATSPPRSG